ncbi:hypothetical protein [Cellulomonas sp. ICMP 17802]|uniref:hypothetical protein n=1 Tax=Cellulomonas sp. ICMP 17802 TaxID=3239199 RepID=UPI00351B871E
MTHETRRAGRVAGCLMVTVAAFQGALALGAPWGEAAYGGATVGVLGAQQRISSAVAVPVYLAIAAVADGRVGSTAVRRRFLRAASAVMAVGSLVNLASPSLVERVIWVPVTVVATIALWRAAPGAPDAPSEPAVA